VWDDACNEGKGSPGPWLVGVSRIQLGCREVPGADPRAFQAVPNGSGLSFNCPTLRQGVAEGSEGRLAAALDGEVLASGTAAHKPGLQLVKRR